MKNAQIVFPQRHQANRPSRGKFSGAWHTHYVIAGTKWRRPRKLRFGRKTSFYLHIGWSLGPLATDTFLLRWSSSKYSLVLYWCKFSFKEAVLSRLYVSAFMKLTGTSLEVWNDCRSRLMCWICERKELVFDHRYCSLWHLTDRLKKVV